MPARAAMLRVHSLHGKDRGSFAALGEWKVIAEPGTTAEPGPMNIADPVRGGHVARHAPFVDGFDNGRGMLDEGLERRAVAFDPAIDDAFELVVGFQDGRAAQVERLLWQDPEGSLEGTRLAAVDVEVGLDGPLGPWRRLGTWDLGRGPDGSVAPFAPSEPQWARYLRISGPLPAGDAREVEFPGRLEVLERATDDGYRSILGEWGYTSDAGPYEWLVPDPVSEAEPS
jgi:hypothetical protein